MHLRSKTIILATILILLVFVNKTEAINMTNLICKGDFQYKVQQLPNTQNYKNYASNYSCWYDLAGGVIEIKIMPKSFTPILTAVCDMVAAVPTIPCQNVFLENGKQYRLNFSVYNVATIAFSTIKVRINNSSAYNFTTTVPIKNSNTSYRFIANQTNNSLCFDFTEDPNNNNNLVGPFLDNVTLVKLSPDEDYYKISCTTTINYSTWEVDISCSYNYNTEIEYYLNLLRNYLKMYASSQQPSFNIMSLNSTNLLIRIQPGHEYSMKRIVLIIEGQDGVGVPVPEFDFEVESLSAYIVKMDEKENSNLRDIYTFSETLVSWTEKVYTMLKTTFASYFLINIINFWNLSLMYNVLSISTIPAFSKSFLEKLTFLFFNLNSLIEWGEENLQGMKGRFDFTQIDGRQFLQEKKNGFAWFGAFGLSSNFVKNNLETFVLILLMLVKIGLVLLLRKIRCIRKYLKKVVGKKKKMARIFLLEIISMEVFMVMSGVSSLLNMSFVQAKQKINCFLHVLNIWVCLVVIALYFQVSINIRTKTPPFRKRIEQCDETITPSQFKIYQDAKRHNKKVVITEFNNVFEFVPIVLVPALILFDCPLVFLLVTTFIVLCRLYWFCKYAKQLDQSLDEKVFNGFNIFFWIVLQVSYITLWVFEKVTESGGLDEDTLSKISYCIKVIGLVIMFTVLIGGLFEILRFVIQLLKRIAKAIRYVIRKCKERYGKQNKIKPIDHQDHHKHIKQGKNDVRREKIKVVVINNLGKELKSKDGERPIKVTFMKKQHPRKKRKKGQKKLHEIYRLHVQKIKECQNKF